MKWKKMFLVGVYKGEMTYSKSEGLHAKWLPKMPGHREFSSQEMAQYRAGRDSLISEVAKARGGIILVSESPCQAACNMNRAECRQGESWKAGMF